MLEIYFDGVLLDNSNYLSLSQKGSIFDKTFKLGTTMARTFELEIPKSKFNPNVKEVVIKYMKTDYAHLILESYKINEGSSIPTVKLKLSDKLILANIKYDASEIFGADGSTTTGEILKDICQKIGVECGTPSFINDNVKVTYYDNTIQAREYLSYLGEIAGGLCRIEQDGKLYLRALSDIKSNPIIPELCEKLTLGENHTVERVVFDNGVLKYQTSADESLETLYLNNSNVYITSKESFDLITSKVLNFKYCNIDTGNTYILPNSLPGDILTFTYENVEYKTIEQFDTINFLGSWQGQYKLQLDSMKQEETRIVGNAEKIKGIKVELNRLDNKLTIIVEDVSSQKETNNDLLNKINANTSKIEQESNKISQSVTEIHGTLSDDIKNLSQILKDENEALKEKIINNTTLITQLSDRITSTIKQTGGNNLLRNSVGFAGLDFWEHSGNVITEQDYLTEQNTISGSKFRLVGNCKLKQYYNTSIGDTYGVSFKLRHILVGTPNKVYIRIHRTETDYDEVLVNGDTDKEFADYTEFNTHVYKASMISPFIEIINTGDDILDISDLIVSHGENQVWSGYFDEVYGKEHRLDKYGLKLKDLASGNKTSVTNASIRLENGRGEVTALLSEDAVSSSTGYFKNKMTVGELQTVVLDNDNIIEYK